MKCNFYKFTAYQCITESPYSFRGIQKYSKITMMTSQPAITCFKLTIETLEQRVKYVQS